ncbi:MAG: CYTH domain-containing protein [Motiliproteus sp.]
MQQEIELKLSLPEVHRSDFSALALLKHYASAEPRVQPQISALQNCYFDTPEQLLNQHAIALRIRHSNGTFIQTLKTRGSSRGGLHQRHEWEWPVPSEQLQLALLPDDVFPQTLQPASLQVAFHTDFQRSCWLLDYPLGDQWASIELVLDSGWVSVGQRRDRICEIELELKDGPVEALFALAAELAVELPLRISRVSKAEKGYRLNRRDQAFGGDDSSDDCPVILGHFELENCQQWLDHLLMSLEEYQFERDSHWLNVALEAFDQLGQQLQHGGAETELTGLLIQQHRSLEELLALTPTDTQVQLWFERRELGGCLLQISQWLFQHPR